MNPGLAPLLGSAARAVRGLVILPFVLLLAVAQQSSPNPQTEVIVVPERPQKPQPPPVTLQKALQIAEKYVEENNIDIGRYWLREAKWILFGPARGPKEPRWLFFWDNLENSMGDYVEITVDMKGQALRMPSM